jgi:hypothetical protein
LCTRDMTAHMRRFYINTEHIPCTLGVSATLPQTFKIIDGQRQVYLNDFIHKRESAYSFRYTNMLTTPNTRTVTYGTNCVRTLAANVWNSLPENARETVCFNDFKMFIKTWNGFTCKCANNYSVCF